MKTCFLFSFIKSIRVKDRGVQQQNLLVLFFPYRDIMVHLKEIQLQLRDYFFNNTLPDQLVIICFDFNRTEIADLFGVGSDIYNFIPKFEYQHGHDNVFVVSITSSGRTQQVIGPALSDDFFREIYRRGMTKIFNKNGGQIFSQIAHHFVFPSGKHCDRFLRTGNVLINGNELFFLASAILLHFKDRPFDHIYCDTSSINSLAYAYILLLNELGRSQGIVPIESFGSYELFEKSTFRAPRNSLFLISSSTSGSILRRMTSEENKSQNIPLDNIAVIYGLTVETEYRNQIVCDLGVDSLFNPDGLAPFVSYNSKRGEKCHLCEAGSTALKVEGDVFLLEKPIVSGYRITLLDQPPFLKTFGKYYKPDENEHSLIRCYYKENATNDKKYELYIDVERLLNLWGNKNKTPFYYKEAFDKLSKYISKNIPATLKYMIALPDKASRILAEIIAKILNENGLPFDSKCIFDANDLSGIDPNNPGMIAIISSSIVSGRNLLYLSRALRDCETTHQRMYFTFLSRTENKEHSDFLESNLGLGEFGAATHKIVNIETVYCPQEAKKTPWHDELEFIKSLQEFCDNKGDFHIASKYCLDRIEELNNSGKEKGLENNLFFPSFRNSILKINNGFAFAPEGRPDFIINTTQSEVYFIISCILNSIRNKGKLRQSEYVRNLIEPGNFVRFNDGIIQACLLRAATPDELKYHLSDEMSLQMQAILGDMIVHLADNHAEALNEFLYAIAIKKLRLPAAVVADCISLLENQTEYKNADTVTRGLVAFIKQEVLLLPDVTTRFDKVTPLFLQMIRE